MEPTKLTLQQRLEADSPVFFKRLDLTGVALIAIGYALSKIEGMPINIYLIIGAIGATLSAISKFAVKDASALSNPNANLQDYIDLGKNLKDQVTEVDQTIKNTIEAVENPVKPPAIPATDIPVVKDEPAVVIPKDTEAPVYPHPATVTGSIVTPVYGEPENSIIHE